MRKTIYVTEKNIYAHRILPLLLAAVILLVGILPAGETVHAEGSWPVGPEVSSVSACVMEVQTGTVLYEKNAHEKHYPASITKILTTLLAVENCELDEKVVFSADAVFKNEGDTSHISRDLNEEMTMEETLLGVMLESANECAWAAGEHTAEKVNGGGMPEFVDMMNERAAGLGCTDTHFNNPNGLPDENHYTSAYDMALIGCEAYRNDVFRMITGTKKYTIPPTNKHKDPTYLNNHHKILHLYKSGNYVSPYCTGGKTGYTTVARSTLVTFAEKNGLQLCIVVMNAQDPAHYLDTLALMDFAFGEFEVCRVDDEGGLRGDVGLLNDKEGLICADEDGYIVLPKNADYEAVTHEINQEHRDDDAVAVISYNYEGRQVGNISLIRSGEYAEPPQIGIRQDWLPRLNIRLILMVAGSVLGAILLVAFLISFRNGLKARRRRRAKRKAQRERLRPYKARRKREKKAEKHRRRDR